jgi:hypothetical protein
MAVPNGKTDAYIGSLFNAILPLCKRIVYATAVITLVSNEFRRYGYHFFTRFISIAGKGESAPLKLIS